VHDPDGSVRAIVEATELSQLGVLTRGAFAIPTIYASSLPIQKSQFHLGVKDDQEH
jgi:hypothetical protein